jgi:hypothetical protein
MMETILRALFGCSHNRYSFPQTPKGRKRPEAAGLTGTYVCCLDCGKEFPYDMKAMSIVSAAKAAVSVVPAMER